MKTKLIELIKKGGGLSIAAAVIIFGAALLILSPSSEKKETVQQTAEETDSFSLEETERRIAAALSRIDGAGNVAVVLTLKSDGLTELATDKSYTERDAVSGEKNREQREENVVVGAGSSVQTPVTVRQGYPEYQGALVIAEGAGDSNVKLDLTRAISALTGLGADRITVAKMKSG